MKKLPKLNKVEKNSINLLIQFYERVRTLFYADTYDKNDKDSFYCIPYYGHIVEILMIIKKYYTRLDRGKNVSFLDVGCGVGHIVHLAHTLGFDAYGLEYHRLKELTPFRKMIIGDALSYKDYGEFDVIYCYQIFKTSKLLEKLYRTIAKQAKPGTIIVPVGQYYGEWLLDKCEKVQIQSSYVYIKK